MVYDDSGNEKTFTKIKRSQNLTSLLEDLKKEDPLFRHNVPSVLEDIYDDTKLLEHLKEQYSQTEFYIRDVAEIKQYATTHDKILANKTLSGRFTSIENSSKCIVRWQQMGGNLAIESLDGKSQGTYSVPKKDILVYGKKRSVLGDIYYNSQTRTFEKGVNKEHAARDAVPPSTWNGSFSNCYVIYIGADIGLKEWHVPEGTIGILANVPADENKKNYAPQIIWMQSPGLKVPLSYQEGMWKTNTERHLYHLHDVPVTWKDIILVKQNTLSFNSLYAKHFSEEGDKRDVVTPISSAES